MIQVLVRRRQKCGSVLSIDEDRNRKCSLAADIIGKERDLSTA